MESAAVEAVRVDTTNWSPKQAVGRFVVFSMLVFGDFDTREQKIYYARRIQALKNSNIECGCLSIVSYKDNQRAFCHRLDN
jgi:hypothetical protein